MQQQKRTLFVRNGHLRLPRLLRVLALAAPMLALALLVYGFLLFADSIDRTEKPLPRSAHAAVVLTGGPDRIAEAVRLVAEGRIKRLLVSGINQSTSMDEISRLSPRFHAYANCCIDLGYQATNTFGNAMETKHWVQENQIGPSLVVVTATYHMPRALVELHAAMPALVLIPYPVVNGPFRNPAWWHDAGATRMLALEYLKYCLARIRIALHPLALERG